MVSAFHHVSLLTRNKEKNRRFYTELLGLRFVKNTVNQDNHRMLHYYYGDYQGSPGSVVTFFVVPALGQRYEEDHYLSRIGLKIPQGSLDFWQERLTQQGIIFQNKGKELEFQDPDCVILTLTEIAAPSLTREKQVQNDIPGQYQILGLHATDFHVSDPEATIYFFKELLNWHGDNQKIQLNATDYIGVLASHSEQPSRMGRGSMDHVAFAVEDEHQLKLLQEKAEKQGWAIEKLVSRGYFKSLYIREPGGNRVEFATLEPGFTLDEPLDQLGNSLALPSFLENQRAEIIRNIYPDR